MPQTYPPPVSRFAPNPSGPLHFGSLVSALGSYLMAKSQGGRWRVRIEDIDLSRNVPGADQDILNTLAAWGLEWDGDVVWQSQRTALYQEAFHALDKTGLLYPCHCSRKTIAETQTRRAVDGGLLYPGSCRPARGSLCATRKEPSDRAQPAWRIRTDDRVIAFDDEIQGTILQQLESDVGDFVLLRPDGLFTYQLAVVVDDAEQGITHIIRGADILASTPRQIYLQRCLDLPTPRYAHLPLATNGEGEKLSKQTRAPAIGHKANPDTLRAALRHLGQPLDQGAEDASPRELLAMALNNWNLGLIPKVAVPAVNFASLS